MAKGGNIFKRKDGRWEVRYIKGYTSTADNPGSRTRIVIGTPKSDTSIRTIPITDYTAELCGKMNPHSSAAYVLTGTENYMEPLRFVTRLGKLCIIELLLHEQIGIFRLQALDGGQLFQRQIVKRLLRCLVDEDVALVRIVIFSGIPGLAIGGVDISGFGIVDDVRFQNGDLCHLSSSPAADEAVQQATHRASTDRRAKAETPLQARSHRFLHCGR